MLHPRFSSLPALIIFPLLEDIQLHVAPDSLDLLPGFNINTTPYMWVKNQEDVELCCHYFSGLLGPESRL